jgi:hypothetical protein
MIRLLAIAIGVGSVAQDNPNLTNLVALMVALGTLAAGVVAYLRLRQDRPKVIAEIAGMSEKRLRDELNTAWAAVDRLRAREDELASRLAVAERRCDIFEQLLVEHGISIPGQ